MEQFKGKYEVKKRELESALLELKNINNLADYEIEFMLESFTGTINLIIDKRKVG